MIQASIPVDPSAVDGERVDASLDGVCFEMLSSTTSSVDAVSPTRFNYHEADGVLWGEYTGDTVVEGRFAGVREGDTVRLSYNHRSVNGNLVHGNAVTIISRVPGEGLRLTEFYASSDGSPALSFCREVEQVGSQA